MQSMDVISVVEVCSGLWETLQVRLPDRLQVLGRFQRALNLAWDEHVVALVTPDVGAGPFHIVVDHLPPLAASYQLIAVSSTCLMLDTWMLDFSQARRWIPRPDWESLAPVPRFWAFLQDTLSQHPLPSYLLPAFERLKQALHQPDPSGLIDAASALAGLGPGLTPTGDDVLAGVMLRLHLMGHAALAAPMYAAAAPRTTRLSRAFLSAARDGLVNVAWMDLLQALAHGPLMALDRAARRVLAFGATSGADMLHGFLAA